MANYIDALFDRTVPMLQKQMGLAKRRSEAIVSNIANAETPGYRAVDLNFAKELQEALGQKSNSLMKTSSKHMDISSASGSAHLLPDYSGVTKPDGNNVDLDLQMGKLSSNAGEYGKAADMVRKKLQMVRMAIRFAQQ